MKIKTFKNYVADFETTVYTGQAYTEVWAAALVELNTEDVQICGSISDFFDMVFKLKTNVRIYFHNLKFDGEFILSYLLKQKAWKQAYKKTGKVYSTGIEEVEWLPEKYMENNSFKYSISDKGQWYNIILKKGGHIIEIRDSLKLIPVSVKRMGDDFKTKHRKSTMEYEGFRYAGCPITEAERKYIANDVLVVKEALEIMFKQGHDKITIGSNCLTEYKETIRKSLIVNGTYYELFPNLYNYPRPELQDDFKKNHDAETFGDWLRKAYRGGWCYVARGKDNRVFYNGWTLDVNSLYPSMMHSESGNYYPVGVPTFWIGNYIPDIAKQRFYFVRIRTRFKIKAGKLPFIQIKNSFLYDGTECLESSDFIEKEKGKKEKHYKSYINPVTKEVVDSARELTMTRMDYELFLEHYDVENFEILDGCYFYQQTGIFDEYIDKYRKIKQESTGAVRQIAKLFLNNLYGKMAANEESSFKVAFLRDDGSLGFYPIEAYDKEPGYIAIGAAITSYARRFTIRAAQENYHGKNRPGFIYADTDSIHCDLPIEKIKGVTLHPSAFCCWKAESQWDQGYFTRQKTYIEHIVEEDGHEPEDGPYYNIKCAGMPDRCKYLFDLSLKGTADPAGETVTTEEKGEWIRPWKDTEADFLFKEGKPIKREITDFTYGLVIPSKLMPKHISGGIILQDTLYEMRE